ncbi:MAG: hypothetical protein AB1Z98_26205, partial [Nannocystaceae bacterium]
TPADRRRKGTATVLEQLAQDLTGFRARAREYFRVTATTAHLQYLRERGASPAVGGTVDLRNVRRLQRIDGPFDPHAHRVDIRLIETGRGRYNVPNVGLHLWRLRSFEVTRGTARPIAGEPGWYRFDPHGLDLPLFNVPRTEQEITSLAQEIHVPHPLSRLDEHASQLDPVLDPEGLSDPAFAVRAVTGGVDGPALPLEICNLADVGGGLPSHRPPPGTVAVDPEVGRLVFALEDVQPDAPDEVLVDYAYGAAGSVGSGTFDRTEAWAEQLSEDAFTWVRYVTREPTIAAELSATATLEQAVQQWNAHASALPAAAVGCIVLLGGRTRPDLDAIAPRSSAYEAPTTTIALPNGSRLYIVAASVDVQPDGEGGLDTSIVPHRVRAVVHGDLSVAGGTATEPAPRPGGLLLNGLSIVGRVVVGSGELGMLSLAHCTVLPDAGGLELQASVTGPNATLKTELYRSVVGAITAQDSTTSLQLIDSVVQGDPLAIDVPGTAVSIQGSTVMGGTTCRILDASNTILDGALAVEQHQQGCLRFSYAPAGSYGPRRYRCQPDLALEGVEGTEARARILARVQPELGSRQALDPSYALLRVGTAIELRTGAEDGGEIGVHQHLRYMLREANLRHALRQYLRFGLEAGLILES